MPFDKDFLTELSENNGLSNGEQAAFLAVFGTDNSRVQICQELLFITEKALSGRLIGVYRKFSIRETGPVKERELRKKLIQLEKKWLQSRPELSEGEDQGDVAQPDEKRDLPTAELTEARPEIDWSQASQALLNEQIQQLTTNPLTHTEGVFHRTEQVYVPLGLVRRQRQPRRGEDVAAQEGSKLYEETEIAEKFEHDQFLESVLRQRQSPQSNGKRIAIIGEPGAGKTTLLQQIGRWAFKNIDGTVVIWISLADLQDETLESYLLGRWLRAISHQQGKSEVSVSLKDAFLNLCQQERVWLLLDGLDEMQASSGNALGEIARQLSMSGFLLSVRLILSCRSNLWDGNRNALSRFDTFRTLEFSYPEQVEKFIQRWFETLPEASIEHASKLVTALQEPGKERIQDLVKNPLRLTLLCFNWRLGEGRLPETKANLYEQYVDDFYEWKKDIFPTTLNQRKLLNKSFGELACEAINEENHRFRLSHGFVSRFLGEPDDEDSLFYLALGIGWINKIGFDSERKRNPIYAFYHPTFEEYFAALSVNDWSFFLQVIPDNPLCNEASYRIFEPQWHEVIMLWLGRRDISARNKSKFIDEITLFEDGCAGCYEDNCFFLAVNFVSEFKEYELTHKLVEQLLDYAFGYCEDGEWINLPDYISEKSKNIFKLTSQDVLASAINKIYKCKPLSVQLKYAELLIENNQLNETALTIFRDLSHNSEDEYVCMRAAEGLIEIEPGSSIAQDAFEKLRDQSTTQDVRVEAAINLLRTNSSHALAIKTLIQVSKISKDVRAIEGLGYALESSAAQKTLKEIIETLEPNVEKSYEAEDCESYEDESEFLSAYWTATDSLISIERQNESQLARSEDEDQNLVFMNYPTEEQIETYRLQDLEEDNLFLSTALRQRRNGADKKVPIEDVLNIYLDLCEVLTSSNQESSLMTSLEREVDETERHILQQAEDLLGGQDKIVLLVIEKLKFSEEDDEQYFELLHKLECFAKGSSMVIEELKKLIVECNRMNHLDPLFWTLVYIGGVDSKLVIEFLLVIALSQQPNGCEWIGEAAARNLVEILKSSDLMEKLVYNISNYIFSRDESEISDEIISNCQAILWHCSQYLNYPQFFYAWFSE